MSNILVAVDFSPCSHKALDAATSLARDLGVSITVVHAFETRARGMGIAGTMDPINELFAQGEVAEAMRLTEELLNPVRAQSVDVELHAREGRAKSVVLDAIKETKPLFVVMGHHGSGGLRLGSLAKAVLDKAHCPVMVVPGDD